MDVFLVGGEFFVGQEQDLNAPSPREDWRMDAVARSVLRRWSEQMGRLEAEIEHRRRTGFKRRIPGIV